MRPENRENLRYLNGADNPIETEEKLMFSLLPHIPQQKELENKLLDIGCGVGSISDELRKRNFTVTGIDFSEAAIQKCLVKGLDASLSDIDKDGLKFPDNYFDIVWAGDVIEHVFDPLSLFDEIYRVMKDAGQLILSVPNDFNIFSRLKIFITGKSIQSNTYKKLRQCKHHTFFSWELLKFMVKHSNLGVKKYFSICNIPKTKIEMIVKNKIIGILFGRVFIIQAYKKQ